MTDHEALETLSKCVDRGKMPSFDTVSAVVGLYRTGQLIPAPSGDDVEAIIADKVRIETAFGQDYIAGIKDAATAIAAAISAMQVKP